MVIASNQQIRIQCLQNHVSVRFSGQTPTFPEETISRSLLRHLQPPRNHYFLSIQAQTEFTFCLHLQCSSVQLDGAFRGPLSNNLIKSCLRTASIGGVIVVRTPNFPGGGHSTVASRVSASRDLKLSIGHEILPSAFPSPSSTCKIKRKGIKPRHLLRNATSYMIPRSDYNPSSFHIIYPAPYLR
jgi:hypothetical protein